MLTPCRSPAWLPESWRGRLALTSYVTQPAFAWVVRPCWQLRLLANLLDGMVRHRVGPCVASGERFNEVPNG